MSPTNEPRTVVRAMWVTRPTRRQTGRKIAGVAEAIGRRYDVDPVLIRIAFVVTALYGPGIVLYLAAWAALPVDPHDPPTGRLRGASWIQPVIVAAAVIAGWLALARGGAGVVLGLALVALLLYLLHEQRGDRAEPDTDAAEGTEPATAPAEAGPPVPSATNSITGTVAGAGSEESAPVATIVPRRRSRLAPATLGLTLVAGGITGGIVLGTQLSYGPRLVAGVMLAVVSIGMLIGAFLRRGRTLLLLAVPLVVICYVTTRLGPLGVHDAGVARFAPVSASQLAPRYQHTVGEITLDLRRLELTAPPNPPGPAGPAAQPNALVPPGPAEPPAPAQPPPPAQANTPLVTRIDARAGEVNVVLPPDADVTLRCHTDFGTLQCLTPRPLDGSSLTSQVTDLGADGKPGGRPLDITITLGAGTVRVTRD